MKYKEIDKISTIEVHIKYGLQTLISDFKILKKNIFRITLINTRNSDNTISMKTKYLLKNIYET